MGTQNPLNEHWEDPERYFCENDRHTIPIKISTENADTTEQKTHTGKNLFVKKKRTKPVCERTRGH